MNVGTQLTKAGALRNITSLKEVVADYRKRFRYHRGVERSEGHHDPVVDWTREATSLSEAIIRAVAGRRRDGKMFSEDSMVRRVSKGDFTERLLEVGRLTWERTAGKGFDALHDFIEERAPWGCGPLIIYNVAARLGAFLGGVEPHGRLYLHTGPLKGWKALTGAKGSPRWVPRSEVPKALLVLPMHQVEDLLCEYHQFLHGGLLKDGR